MARRGRPAYADPPVEFKVYIPASLAARVKLECYNSLRQNAKYGAQSALMITALQLYFKETDKNVSSTAVDGNGLGDSPPQAHEAGNPPSVQASWLDGSGA